MKKKLFSMMAVILMGSAFFSQQARAQAPQTITYQSVIRNAGNALLGNSTVGTKVSILRGSADGEAVYAETHIATTNANGLLSFQVGAGTAVLGSFAQIDWASGPFFIKTETDPAGGSNYSIVGTQQMASVPYALYAAKSGNAVFEPTIDIPDAIHNTNQGNVGIGTDLPSEKLDVAGNLKVRGNLSVGYGSIASGYASSAIGRETVASNSHTFAGGYGTIASGGSAFSMGEVTNASGWVSTAMGVNTIASGPVSTAIGINTTAKSFAEAVIGMNNTDYQPGSAEGYMASDRLFVIGNGADANNKSDALVMLKNGNTTISGAVTANSIKIPNGTNTQYLMADGTTSAGTAATTMGTVGASSTANGATISSGVLSLAPADASNPGIVTTADQTFAGSKTFVSDININGITVGAGGGGYSEYDVAIGYSALLNNTTGYGNTALGASTLSLNTGGTDNTAVGNGALQKNSSGYRNTVIGSSAQRDNINGYENTATGFNALMLNISGYNNIANGSYALSTNTTGSNNSALGYNADVSSDNLSNATAIGASAIVDASNKIQLGNTGVTAVNTSGIYTGAGFKTPNGTNTQYLMANGTTSTGTVATTMGAVGASSTANGATIASGVLSLAPANATNAGIVTTADQTFAGNKTFSGSATAGSFVKTGGTSAQYLMADGTTSAGTVATTMGAVGASSTANGATIASGVLSLAPADASNPGIVTTAAQTFAGNKTFSGSATAGSFVKTGGTAAQYLMANGTTSAGTVATTMGAVGASSTANGATIASGVLSLAPADATNAGVVTTAAQTFAGNKTFSGSATAGSFVKTGGTSSDILMADGSSTRIVRGSITDPNASTGSGPGYTFVRFGTGIYDITFATPFQSSPVCVATLLGSYGFISTFNMSSTSFTVVTRSATTATSNFSFSFIVMSP